MIPLPLSVPVSTSSLTTEWFQSVLAGAFPMSRPEVASVERIGEDRGFSSEIARCVLGGSEAPRSLVVKLWATDGQAGANEVSFYETFGPTVGVRVPACYHGRIDEALGRGVLVLEDLGRVGHGDCLGFVDAEGGLRLARALAGLHATWWNRSELQSAAWLPSHNVVLRDAEWLSARRETFLSRFGDTIHPMMRPLVERIEVVQECANERLAEATTSLLHGDLHLDNVVFEGTDDSPALLDWTRVARGPVALDLAELLFSMAPLDEFAEVLGAYLDEMERRGVPGCDEDSLNSALGGALLRRVVRLTCGIAEWFPETERQQAILDTEMARTVKAIALWQMMDPELLDV